MKEGKKKRKTYKKVLLNFASRSHNLYGCTSPTVRFFFQGKEHALFSSHTFAQGSHRESLQFILQNTNHKSKVILNHLWHWISNLSLFISLLNFLWKKNKEKYFFFFTVFINQQSYLKLILFQIWIGKKYSSHERLINIMGNLSTKKKSFFVCD